MDSLIIDIVTRKDKVIIFVSYRDCVAMHIEHGNYYKPAFPFLPILKALIKLYFVALLISISNDFKKSGELN